MTIRLTYPVFYLVLLIMASTQTSQAASRIKDIVYFEGIRDNVLVGYGLVAGLNGTGDNLKNAPFTEKGLEDFLSRLGINTKGTALKTKNVAAVTVTASLPAFARSGNKFDVSISTIGDAKSLQGGVLLAAPLFGADGNVYAVAQGNVTIGELKTEENSGNASNKSNPTSGFVINGATVEKEIAFDLGSLDDINLSLRNPDLSTARRVAENINDVVGEDVAFPTDPGTVKLTVPEIYEGNIVGLLSDIEQIIVEPDQIAKIVIDESTGTIVIGEEVKVDTIAIAQGNLLVKVNSDARRRNSNRFQSDLGNEEDLADEYGENNDPGNGFAIVRQTANLRDLVGGLNALGVGTRDIISILETIKAAGALHATIETR